MAAIEATVYLLCLATSAVCTLLLLRAYLSVGTTLLVWSALCFAMLTLNNSLVVADVLLLPQVDLTWPRLIAALAAVCLLLYGFIWEL